MPLLPPVGQPRWTAPAAARPSSSTCSVSPDCFALKAGGGGPHSPRGTPVLTNAHPTPCQGAALEPFLPFWSGDPLPPTDH